MPIKPENKHRYPDNWYEIRMRILDRAGYRCEGSPLYPDCRVGHHWIGYRVDGEFRRVETRKDAERRGHKAIQIVLTIAHMNHIPEDCDYGNLRALCQRCHLAHDREHHRINAARTLKSRKALGDLFNE